MKNLEAASLGAAAGFGLALWGLLSAEQLSSTALRWDYAAARDENYVQRQYLQGVTCVKYQYDSGERENFDWCRSACKSKYSRSGEMALAACNEGVDIAERISARPTPTSEP